MNMNNQIKIDYKNKGIRRSTKLKMENHEMRNKDEDI